MKKVNEIMIDSPFYCEAGESLLAVARQMSAASVSSIPVVNAHNKVIGMIRDRDICVVFSDESSYPLSERTVEDAMSQEVYTCTPEDNLDTVLKAMRLNRVGQLVVVDEQERLAGIVTLSTVVKRLYGSNETQIQYTGSENILKTLYSLADRNMKEYVSVTI
ncbi:MAG: CBS domain-containing protein [Bacteroidota bacterium]